MIKMTLKLLDAGTKREFVGSERDAEAVLRRAFPNETADKHSFMSCVEAVNEEGFGEVDVSPYKEPRERNLLAPDYDADIHREDPWVREGDQE